MFDLSRKVAIVTGGSQGLGFGMAQALADAGADIVVVNRRPEQGEAAAERIAGRGVRALAVPADVSVAADVSSMVQRVLDEFGRIDVLVNNAGVLVRKSALEMIEEEWDRVLDINLKGAWLCAREVGRHLVQRERGKVVNIGSLWGLVGYADRSAYAASKAGLSHLTRVLALEWASHNVQVNAIAPGWIKTEINEEYLESDQERLAAILAKVPTGRLGRPDDLAGIVVLLASDASNFLTGQTIAVDGGWTIQ